MNYKSVLDNIVYLDIETTGLDPCNFETIEIGAIKTKDSIKSEISISINPHQEGLYNEHAFENGKIKLNNFIESLPIICHNKSSVKVIFDSYFSNIKPYILDSKELAAILEPYRRSFELKDILNQITTIVENEIHSALDNARYTMLVINSLLCRLWQKEEETNKVNSLFNVLNRIFNNKVSWGWVEYLLKPLIFDSTEYPYVLYKEKPFMPLIKENIKINYEKYEQLLRENEIWDNGGDFKYQYRPDQESISLQIRKNYENEKRIFIEAPTGSGKTFAYLLIGIIVTYLNMKNKNYEDSNFVISTDTKELQNQLIDKDIPNILRKLNLYNKIRYGAIKGKGNYLCMERLKKSKEFEEDKESLLAFIFLMRYGEDGTSGDLENINLWALNHFKVDKYIVHINCDSENCNLDRCKTKCYLKNRYNELQKENITVVNHSLLASWPYSEKRKINHLIIDEAHILI